MEEPRMQISIEFLVEKGGLASFGGSCQLKDCPSAPHRLDLPYQGEFRQLALQREILKD
jgi:hypothetical protein